MSRFPVRSPFPNNVPSTRSAPASNPNSVAATPVERSLCVCRLIVSASRFLILRQIHAFAVHADFQLAEPVRLDAVGGIDVGGPDHAAHGDHLPFGIDLNVLDRKSV